MLLTDAPRHLFRYCRESYSTVVPAFPFMTAHPKTLLGLSALSLPVNGEGDTEEDCDDNPHIPPEGEADRDAYIYSDEDIEFVVRAYDPNVLPEDFLSPEFIDAMREAVEREIARASAAYD